jgi:RNA polymerase sigma-70 factor (ECF subfamily)
MSSRLSEGGAVLAEGQPLPPEDRLASVPGAGLETLYREHRPRLLRFLRRRTSNDNAADLVQQVFARMAGLSVECQRGIANPAGYLRRSVANLVLDEAKMAARRSAGRHVSTDDLDLPAADQIAALEARDMLQRLELALQRLKPRTREIFLAHRIDGYSYVEIAALTGLSVKGVEKHMSRAIAFVDRVFATR